MKKQIIILIALSVLIISCGENSTVSKIRDAKDDLSEISKMASGIEKVGDKTQKLSELTPMNKETIKAWMPESLGELNRTEYKIGNEMGYANVSNVSLVFKDPNNKQKVVSMDIIDGAGTGSVLAATYFMILKADVDSEDEKGYKRTEVLDGVKVMAKYSKYKETSKSSLEFVLKDRLLVNARGVNMEVDELWAYINKLNIEELID